MKLGLKIEITSQGAGSPAKTYNSTPALEKFASASRSFIKEVFPTRDDLKSKGIDPSASLDESARSVIFLRFLGTEGYLICIFQARPEGSGRAYDGSAAWIHVPSSVMLTGSETERIIDEVDAALSDPLRINYESLDILFAKEYEQKNVISVLSSIASNGPTSGIRYYGAGTDYELSELLGSHIAQQVYGNYKAIFLLRKNDHFAVSAPEITTPLVQTCIMSAPSSIAGYNAFFENGLPYNVDLEYPVNTPLTIVWKKTGYQDIPKKALAKRGNSNDIAKLFIMNQSEIKVAIKKQIFNVYGDGRFLDKFDIFIDRDRLNNILYVEEEKLAKGVRVKVVADGFKTYLKDLILNADTQQVDIPLKRETFIYELSIPMYADGKYINDGIISIETNRRLDKCPIEGYSFSSKEIIEGENNVNHLEKSYFDAIKHFAYGFLTCVGIVLAVYLFNVIEKIKDINFKFGWPPIEFVMYSDANVSTEPIEKEPSSPNSPNDNHKSDVGNNAGETESNTEDKDLQEKAINYLNSTTTWNKDSIAYYPFLEGLFEALNKFDFQEIVNTWGPKLKNVPEFQKVVEAANTALNEDWKSKQVNPTTYNRVGDNLIMLNNYLKRISVNPYDAVSQPKGNHIKDNDKSNTPSDINQGKRGKVQK